MQPKGKVAYWPNHDNTPDPEQKKARFSGLSNVMAMLTVDFVFKPLLEAAFVWKMAFNSTHHLFNGLRFCISICIFKDDYEFLD